MAHILSACTDRRTFLKAGISTLLASFLPVPAFAAVNSGRRILTFYNTHTGESLRTCYRLNGKLIPREVRRISYILRDYRTNEVKPVDPALLDLLYRVMRKARLTAPIAIVSGYRSPATNSYLRKVSTGVARNSLHMQGRAIDIRIPGYRTAALRRLAIELKTGGVGYYPKSDFLHLDTGPFKTW